MRKVAIALALAAAACSNAAEEPAENRDQQPAAAAQNGAAPAAARGQGEHAPPLAGEWRVTKINDGPVRQAYAMGASVTGDRLTIVSDCVRMAWSLRQDRNIVYLTPVPTASCERSQTDDENTVERIVGLLNMAIFSDGGREVRLSGSGGSITMTRR